MRRLIPPLAILASVIFSVIVLPRLPAVMPIHWGLHGRPDGWAPKMIGAFVIPAVALVVYAVLRLVLRYGIRGPDSPRYIEASERLIALIIFFVAFTHVVMVGSALDWPLDVPKLIVFGIGAMFIMIGAEMVNIPRNPFFGLRTPWTMRSERVWAETHRVGARIMVLCGLAISFSALLAPVWMFAVILLGVLGMVVGTLGYSWYVAKRFGD